MYLDLIDKTMQVVSSSSPAHKFVGKDRFAEVYGELSDDFGSKLKMEEEENREKSWWNQEESDDDEEKEGEEFSFASVNPENSPITADEAFEDGQIRPVYPLFNRDLFFDPEEKSLRSPLKKLFVENEEAAEASTAEESEPLGPFCSWSGRTVEQASPETCRKSNSTGFSKLRRFRDLVLRSNSDGRDAFVFLNADKNNQSSGVKRTEKAKEEGKTMTTLTEKKKNKSTKSAHERLYMRNRALREEGKRRSYLPYKHVGFFTNVNGLSRNVHPY